MSKYDSETIKFAKEQERAVQNFKYREHVEENDHREGERDHLRRDYARVLYSSSFRRLQGKMQLLGIDPTHFHRNRLTHSLEVAQIAGGIARDLGLKAPVVSETCSLSHDIGNPPFGHAGEAILNELARGIGGYEGNAQTFRVLRHLEKKHYNYPGLNLTLRTLLGVTKYFYEYDQGKNKKFLYDDDYQFLKKQIHDSQVDIKRSIDVQIMDLADEIAYAAHDLEDSLTFGFMTLSEVMYEFQISQKYKEASDEFNRICTQARYAAQQARRLETSEEYSFILRKELTSNIVYTLMRAISVVEQNGTKELGYDPKSKLLSEGLKKLVFKSILRKRDIQLYEKTGEKVIRGLFEVYTDPKFNKGLSLLPPELRAMLPKSETEPAETWKRLSIDYIAGMMDSFAIQEYKRYFGDSSLEKLYDRNLWQPPQKVE